MIEGLREPPVARRDASYQRRLHGIGRPDPYHWMRDVDSPEVLDHLKAERAYYDAAVTDLRGLKDELTEAVTARIPDTEVGPPVDHGRFTYYLLQAPGRENGEVRRFPRAPVGSPGRFPPEAGDELVLDIDALAGGSSYVDIGLQDLSPDENLLAYSVDAVGDEVFELRFRDLRTATDLPDRIPRSNYTGAWSADGQAFFYTVHDETYRPFAVRRHILGTDSGTDATVFTEDDEQYEVEVRGLPVRRPHRHHHGEPGHVRAVAHRPAPVGGAAEAGGGALPRSRVRRRACAVRRRRPTRHRDERERDRVHPHDGPDGRPRLRALAAPHVVRRRRAAPVRRRLRVVPRAHTSARGAAVAPSGDT